MLLLAHDVQRCDEPPVASIVVPCSLLMHGFRVPKNRRLRKRKVRGSQHIGVRSEINVFVDAAGEVHVTGGLQEKVVPILAIG